MPHSAKAGGKGHRCESGNLFFVRCHILSDSRRWKSPEFFKWKEKWTFNANSDLNWGLFPCCPLPLSLLHLGLYSLPENLNFTITPAPPFPSSLPIQTSSFPKGVFQKSLPQESLFGSSNPYLLFPSSELLMSVPLLCHIKPVPPNLLSAYCMPRTVSHAVDAKVNRMGER